jgi:hypothetical protein
VITGRHIYILLLWPHLSIIPNQLFWAKLIGKTLLAATRCGSLFLDSMPNVAKLIIINIFNIFYFQNYHLIILLFHKNIKLLSSYSTFHKNIILLCKNPLIWILSTYRYVTLVSSISFYTEILQHLCIYKSQHAGMSPQLHLYLFRHRSSNIFVFTNKNHN